jgi:YHS domain-containing protein
MTTPLKDEGTQKTCPVMGNSVDKNIFVDYRGKRIYFCCSACPSQFRKDPATYLKKLSENGEKPALLALAPQKTCPVMENPIDKKVFVDHKGKRVYFCCSSCKTEFKKDPEKYLKKLSKMGEAPESL